MLTKLPLLIVPTVLVSVAAIALAAPKPVPPQKPQAAPLMPPLQPSQPKPGKAWSTMPNMTQMPKLRIISAFDLTLSGRRLLTDVSGHVVEQDGLTEMPHFTPKAAVPKPKH